MSRTQTKYTRVLHKSSPKMQPGAEIVDSWDAAIRKAKRQLSTCGKP